MGFADLFAEKLGEYINNSINEFKSSGYAEHTPDSLEFILIYKPLLKIMIEFTPDNTEKSELEHFLTYQRVSGDLSKIIGSKISTLSGIIRQYFNKIPIQTMIKQVYSKDYNKVINLIYEALRYKKNEKQTMPNNYEWLNPQGL